MYLGVYGESETEIVNEKSRFLAYSAHVESEADAKRYLADLKKIHPLATHVCYAYVADRVCNIQRFSDDGEPQGTAGMPILGVLKSRKLCETLIAVVRYFGGIKLGAGGLTRAYAQSAAQVLERAEIREYDLCATLSVTADYTQADAIARFLDREKVAFAKDYGTEVTFEVAVRARDAQSFMARLNDYVNGKAKIAQTEQKIYPFPLAEKRS